MLVAAFFLPRLLHHEYGGFTAGQGLWLTESCVYKEGKIIIKKRVAHLRAPGEVKPHSGSLAIVPLPLRPWYLQSVVMYAEGYSCNHARAGVGAALLRVL